MKIITASMAVSFSRRLEEDSSKFYEQLAQRYPKYKETFLSMIKENKKNIKVVEREYYEVITDALESCFSFDMDTDNYTFNTELDEEISFYNAVNKTVEMEDKIIEFYLVAARQSKSLMADLPKAFENMSKRRNNRKLKLKSLIIDDKSI